MTRQQARNRGKSAERQVAHRLGGERIGPTGMDTADVSHPLFLIEVKNQKAMPESIRTLLKQVANKRKNGDERVPLLVYKRPQWHGYVVCLDLKDFEDLYGQVVREGVEEATEIRISGE